MRHILLLVFFSIVAVKVKAQEPLQTIRFDTVHLKQGYILTVNNHSYISAKDTVLYIPSSIRYTVKKRKEQGFYEKLDSSAQQNRFTRELRNIILAKRRTTISIEHDSAIKSESFFVPYRGRVIRNITFKQLDVFGPSIEDTTKTTSTWVEKTGNNLHFKTKPYLLRNNLIIKEGDQLDPLKLADNERLLREASYIQDAKIYVNEIPGNDSVDIFIVVKDVWSKAFDLRVDNLYGGRFSLWDRNIFGFGHENQNTMFWNSKENPTVGYEGTYSIPNIGGSFIRGRAQYLDKFGNKTYGVSFDRNFYTPNIKYAGGLSFYRTNKPDYFIYPDTTILSPVEYTKSDFWLGRSFSLNNADFTKSRKNLSLTFRVTNTNILKRPDLTRDEFYNYHSRTLYLSSLSFTKQTYFKSNHIYNFGRTEDIPYGLQIEATGGFETNEFKSRSFIGAKFAWGTYNEKLGYLYFSAGHEGFINASKKIEQGVVYAQFNHFTPLLKLKKFKFRHFVNIDYTKGINRYKDEYLTLNRQFGLNGFVNDSLRGNERFNMHFETVCFSPWYFYEFRFVFFASAELSLFGKNRSVWNNSLYSGFNFGVRIRNERLVFNTIELRFHLYPFKHPYSDTNLITLSGEQVLSPPNFITKPPSTSTFQ